MMQRLQRSFVGMFLVALILLCGCAGTQPSRYYLLDAQTMPTQGDKGDGAIRLIAIGPVEIPTYLDRPQIVTLRGENELHLSEINMWAEPLKDSIPRFLARQLETDIDIAAVVDPWQRNTNADYRLQVTIVRMLGSLGDTALLEARCSLSDERRESPIVIKNIYLSEKVDAEDYRGLVKAYNSLFFSLSREVEGMLEPFGFSKRNPSVCLH